MLNISIPIGFAEFLYGNVLPKVNFGHTKRAPGNTVLFDAKQLLIEWFSNLSISNLLKCLNLTQNEGTIVTNPSPIFKINTIVFFCLLHFCNYNF